MEDETATISETGTALNVNEAANLIAGLDDVADDSFEQTDAHVENDEPTTDETEVEATPDEQFFDFDGEQVSLSDLRNGYLRQKDYTVKTQALAEERKRYNDNQRDINALRSDALQSLEALKQQVAAEFRTMEVPDFDDLAMNDPAEYIRQKAIWDKRENAVRQLWETEQHLKAKAAEHEAEQQKIALQESSAKFYEKYPELKAQGKSEEVFSEITHYLLETGFSKEEIQSVSDFRIIDILYQNIQAKKAKSAVPEVVKKIESKPVLSAKNGSNKPNQKSQSFDQFNKTRSVADAAELIKNLL